MIVRLWKGRASVESADAYAHHVSAILFPKLAQIEGFVRGRVLLRARDRQVEFLVMTEWESWNGIRSFAGDVPDRAIVDPMARDLLSDYDTHVEHFEVVGDSSAVGMRPSR
jgi:hypothetical protein